MTNKESDAINEIVDSVSKHYKGINMTISDATLEAVRVYQHTDFTLSVDAISRMNQISKDWETWGKNVSDALNKSGILQTLSMVDKQMDSVRDSFTVIMEEYDLSPYKNLGQALQKAMERYLEDTKEHPDSSTVTDDTVNAFEDVSHEDNTSPIFNAFAGYLSANYGQQVDPSKDKSKIIIMFLFIFFSQIGANLVNTSIEKAVYPEKDNEQKTEAPYSNFTKEQIDRALDLEERKVKLQENEQKKDSK